VTYETVLALELAAKALTGSTLPFGLAREVLLLAGLGHKRARCCISSPIADLDPHDHSQLYLALQELLTAALPLLARLCQPALLLPGPLQVVVKAQRLVLGAGESYEGVWHEDGLREHIVAVVLYYYRVSAGLSGGNLEFCSKATEVFEAEGGSYQADLVRQWLQHGIRRCQVPVEEGTLLVFSNYAAVHRVLTMVAQQEGGSRDFVAFFVVDQRVPLPSPPLAEREVRLQQREQLMAEQLQPRGKFGLDQADVYGTGLRRGSNLTTRGPTSSLTIPGPRSLSGRQRWACGHRVGAQSERQPSSEEFRPRVRADGRPAGGHESGPAASASRDELRTDVADARAVFQPSECVGGAHDHRSTWAAYPPLHGVGLWQNRP